ncbi:hypothetical protein B0H11DRAFT_1907617 [Mycena galericulata]|nr:hypothetical protein B0H11DRAFT_1907617 [Mycena galericulata]
MQRTALMQDFGPLFGFVLAAGGPARVGLRSQNDVEEWYGSIPSRTGRYGKILQVRPHPISRSPLSLIDPVLNRNDGDIMDLDPHEDVQIIKIRARENAKEKQPRFAIREMVIALY